MGLPKFLSHSAEKELIKNLVGNLSRSLPPAMLDTKRKLLSVNKVTRLLEELYKTIENYQQENQMGFIKRSIFANNFKWELKNLNYPEDFISMATEGLVIALSKKKIKP